jgi:hypothetical protein
MADQPKIHETIEFHYIKSPEYREIACHGAIGNLTPNGKIWMALYAERTPLPRIVSYSIPPIAEGQLLNFNESVAGAPLSVESRMGIIRHVEFSAYLDLDVAERLHKWLGERITQIKAAQQ